MDTTAIWKGASLQTGNFGWIFASYPLLTGVSLALGAPTFSDLSFQTASTSHCPRPFPLVAVLTAPQTKLFSSKWSALLVGGGCGLGVANTRYMYVRTRGDEGCLRLEQLHYVTMSARELITIQCGHYSNFVGAHWWNIQVWVLLT